MNSNLSYVNDGESVENELPDIASTAKISLRTVTAIRGKNAIILKNISFSLGPNGLTVIVGGNASGKTSLLLSMLNELVLTKGDAAFIPLEVNNSMLLLLTFSCLFVPLFVYFSCIQCSFRLFLFFTPFFISFICLFITYTFVHHFTIFIFTSSF